MPLRLRSHIPVILLLVAMLPACGFGQGPSSAFARRPGVAPSRTLRTNATALARPAARRPPGEGLPLTIGDLERLAMEHNPTLVQAARRIAALRGEALQAGLRPNPSIGYIGEEIGDEGTAGQQGIYVENEFITAGKRALDRAVVGHAVDQARLGLCLQQYRVVSDVRILACEVMIADRRLAVHDHLIKIAAAAARATEHRVQDEKAGRAELMRAQADYHTAVVDRIAAQHDRAAAWRALTAVLGLPRMPPRRLVDELDRAVFPIRWDEALCRVLENSPEVVRARAEVEEARCALARAKAERYPDIQTLASARYMNTSHKAIGTFLVGVPLQVFDRNQGNIAARWARLTAAEREVERVELELRQQLAETFAEYETAAVTIDHYRRRVIPEAAAALASMEEDYRAGDVAYLELLMSQETSARVRLAYLDSLCVYHQSATRIENYLLTGGLTRP